MLLIKLRGMPMRNEKNGLSAWQLTMMALGTVIGGSFFLGSAAAIQATGPSIILSYIICGVMVYFILFALSEMTVSTPESCSGSFRTFASKYLGDGAGFVVGWVYWTGMVIAMSSEATAVSLLAKTWFHSVSISMLGTYIIVGVTLLNLLGANQLSRLESVLAAIKVFSIFAFIVMGVIIATGIFPKYKITGTDVFLIEPFLAGGIKSLAGSMLIVLFTYAGFEVIGLAASETKNKQKTVPKAIHLTVFALVGLYLLSITTIICLVPTKILSEEVSPFVTALNYYHIAWASTAMNIILISAILSTMVAAMFGIGRMLRSIVEVGLGPRFLKDKTDVPYKGIVFSGFSMLISLFIGLMFPKVYLFLISSGGFAVLFTYIVLMCTHIRFRKANGKPDGKCRLCAFPYSSLFTLLGLIVAMFSMPFIEGQAAGFFAGILLVVFFTGCYGVVKIFNKKELNHNQSEKIDNRKFLTEFSKENDDLTKKK